MTISLDLKMAWRNIWRNTRRTIITAIAITFACIFLIFMFSWQIGSYDSMINASVKINTGHIQIQHKDYLKNQAIHKTVSKPNTLTNLLNTTPHIENYSFRARAFSLVSSKDRTYGVMIMGVDPIKEKKVSTIEKLIRQGEYLSASDSDSIIIGALLAKNLRVQLNDELTILGQGKEGSVAATIVTVKGIFESGMDDVDRYIMYMPLFYFQDVYTMQGDVHEIVINATYLSKVFEIKKNLLSYMANDPALAELAVLDWMTLTPGLVQSISLDLISGVIFYIILIIVVAFSIFNTFLMAVFERTREFGVMMALGVTPRRLTKILLTESLMLTAIGVVTGVIIGSAITYYFQVYGFDISGMSELLTHYGISGKMYCRLTLLTALAGPVLVFMITFLIALYPAIKVKNLRPIDALVFH